MPADTGQQVSSLFVICFVLVLFRFGRELILYSKAKANPPNQLIYQNVRTGVAVVMAEEGGILSPWCPR